MTKNEGTNQLDAVLLPSEAALTLAEFEGHARSLDPQLANIMTYTRQVEPSCVKSLTFYPSSAFENSWMIVEVLDTSGKLRMQFQSKQPLYSWLQFCLALGLSYTVAGQR